MLSFSPSLNDKAAGPDGFSVELYSVFGSTISQISMHAEAF